MFLGYSVISNDSNLSNVLPLPQAYSQINIYGASIIDEIHLHNVEMTDSAILALSTVETFLNNTLFLSHLDGNFEGGNYSSFAGIISSFNLEKRKTGDSLYTLIANVLFGGLTTYLDYSCNNLQQYEYILLPIDVSGIIGSSITSLATQNFWGWFLSDLDNTVCYKFDMNLSSSSVKSNLDIKKFENHTRYPTISQGLRNYKSGTLNTLPYSLSVDGKTYTIDVSLLNEIEDFINNRQPKILRNTAGEILKVMTTAVEHQYIDSLVEQPYTIQFEYQQIGTFEYQQIGV